MARLFTILGVFAAGGLFGWGVPLLRLFDAFQPMIVALSIMIAAIFVRLNRGMPTLDWKSLELEQRTRLTTSIVQLSGEYGWIVAINAATLAVLVTLSVIGKDEVRLHWPNQVQHIAAAVIGWMFALSVARMAYVIWRDYDIVGLQKHLIDASAARDDADRQAKVSAEKITSIRAAGLRKLPSPEPKAWGE